MGHGGGTAGQEAYLGLLPDYDAVFSVQANGILPPGLKFVREVAFDIQYAITGKRPAEVPPIQRPKDATRLLGTFGAGAWRFEVTEQAGTLLVHVTAEGFITAQRFTLQPVTQSRFAMCAADEFVPVDYLTFVEPNSEGVPQYLFWGCRLFGRQ